MAESPWATAPLLSVAALSTIVMRNPWARAPPVGLERGPAGGHAAPNDQKVGFMDDDFGLLARIPNC